MIITEQLGFRRESTYGTPVTVNQFCEFLTEQVRFEMGTTQSKGLRRGRTGPSASQRARYGKGGKGPVTMEVLSKGFGFWLEQVFGAVDTSAQGGDDEYVHTFDIASLCGKSFTLQSNRALGACRDDDQAFTWAGCKIAAAEFTCKAPEGLMTASFDILTASEVINVALATASYPTATEPMSWQRGFLTWDGDGVDVTEWSIKIDNKLKEDRWYVGVDGRKEPVADGDFTAVTTSFKCDWESTAHYEAFRATANADNIKSFTAGGRSDTPIGGTTYPRLEFSIPNLGTEDAGPAGIDGPSMLMETVTGTAVQDGSDPLIQALYTTADATV